MRELVKTSEEEEARKEGREKVSKEGRGGGRKKGREGVSAERMEKGWGERERETGR